MVAVRRFGWLSSPLMIVVDMKPRLILSAMSKSLLVGEILILYAIICECLLLYWLLK